MLFAFRVMTISDRGLKRLCQILIGQSLASAEGAITRNSLIPRVVSVDGFKKSSTDFREDRINLVINHGVVIDAYVG